MLHGVAVEAAEDEIHAEVGHYHAQKRDERVERVVTVVVKPWHRAAVERERVNQHRYQRPHFLGVPPPVASPRLVGPHRSDEDAGGEQIHRRFQQPAAQLEQVATPAQPRRPAQGVYRKSGVGEHHRQHVER